MGMRKTADGTTLPIRYHLAIDQKPELNPHLVVLYEDKDKLIKAGKITFVENLEDYNDFKLGKFYAIHRDSKVVADNWVYPYQFQAKKTYKVFITKDLTEFSVIVEFEELEVDSDYKNCKIGSQAAGSDYYKKIKTQSYLRLFSDDNSLTFPVYIDYDMTGIIMYYENTIFKYDYVDKISDSSEVLNDNGEEEIIDITPTAKKEKQLIACPKDGSDRLSLVYPSDWRTELYLQGVEADILATDKNYYYTELINEWPKIYDIEQSKFKEDAIKDPTSLDYFLDFIDTDPPMGEFNISNIGCRSIIEVNDKINCIFSILNPHLFY